MKIKNLVDNMLLLCASILFSFLGLELICRVYLQPHQNENFVQPHEKLGEFFIAGKKGWFVRRNFVQYIKTNSKGLRDNEYSYKKPGNTYRIMLPIIPENIYTYLMMAISV